jgi:low affinity Fe/Cu permease
MSRCSEIAKAKVVIMPVTANHVAFALSFASAFFACYVGSQLLSSVLDRTSYDLFGTILGLEKQPENNMSSQLINDFSSNWQLTQLIAIALTVITSVVLFLKLSKSTFGFADVGVETWGG